MIEIKRKLNERESLRMTLMAIMVRKNRKEINANCYMDENQERELRLFLRDLGFTRGEFIASALSPHWPAFTKELQLLNLVPS